MKFGFHAVILFINQKQSNMVKLQLALDDWGLEESIRLVEKVGDDVDIIEVGTPFMMVYGLEAVRRLKKEFPRHEVLCDAKIMDAGAYEAKLCFEAGADYVTVLGVTDNATIKACVDTARQHGKKTVVDMICVPDLPERIKTLERIGVEYLAVHTGVDQQANGRTPLDDLKEMRNASKTAMDTSSCRPNPAWALPSAIIRSRKTRTFWRRRET